MITSTITDGVAEIVLDAPDRLNSLDPDDIAELDAAYAAAEKAGVRALVLRGEGRAFCAGRDISGRRPAHRRRAGLPRRARHAAAAPHGGVPGADVRGRARRLPRRRARAADRHRRRLRRRHREDRLAVREARGDPRLGRARALLRAPRRAQDPRPDLHRPAHVRHGGRRVGLVLAGVPRRRGARRRLGMPRRPPRPARPRRSWPARRSCDRCATSASACGRASTSRTAPRRRSATPTTTARASPRSSRSASRRSPGGARAEPTGVRARVVAAGTGARSRRRPRAGSPAAYAAVADPVVEHERELRDAPRHDRAVDDPRPLDEPADAEDRHLGVVDDRGRAVDAEAAVVVERERRAGELLRARGARARSLRQLADRAVELRRSTSPRRAGRPAPSARARCRPRPRDGCRRSTRGRSRPPRAASRARDTAAARR